jgi:DNA-binding NarL/FixJ family response regulator
MINIAIIDRNETHRASLRTLLGQIDGFRVVMDADNLIHLKNSFTEPPDVIMIDSSAGGENGGLYFSNLQGIMTGVKIIFLAMFKEELDLDYGNAGVVLKSSDKKEFEMRIKKLVAS